MYMGLNPFGNPSPTDILRASSQPGWCGLIGYLSVHSLFSNVFSRSTLHCQVDSFDLDTLPRKYTLNVRRTVYVELRS